jgi:hypothetical protein
VNILLVLMFKLLPIVGAISYVLVPVYVMELPMLSANFVRIEPLHSLWMHIPMLEMIFSIVVMLLAGFEPILCCAFLRAVAVSLRNEILEKKAIGLMRLGTGSLFFFLSYQLCSMAGTSTVLVGLLRVLYFLGSGFWLGFLFWFIIVLFQCRNVIAEELTRA